MFAGMKLYELLTLVGIIIGPIAAVAITLASDAQRRTRDQRMQVLRQLVSTYRFVGDAGWTVAINMVLIEFRKVKRVRDARKAYVDFASLTPAPGAEARHQEQLLTRQTALVYEVVRSMGFDITEGELSTQVYVASGYMNRDNLYINSLRATCEMAADLKRSAVAAERMLERLPDARE